MRRLKVLSLTIFFLLAMALPVIAQGNPSNSPVQRDSFNGAFFFGSEDSTITLIDIFDGTEEKDFIFLEKYFESDPTISYVGSLEIEKANVVFNMQKGTVSVRAIIPLTKVEWIYDEETDSYYANYLENVGSEEVTLIWSFNHRDYSYHKSVNKNIQIGMDEYLHLDRATYKDFNNIIVSGNVGGTDVQDFDFTSGGVTSGTYFSIIK
jgi:hypothetical protein